MGKKPALLKLILALTLFSSCLSAQAENSPLSAPKADLILINGNIHADTDSGHITAQAIAVRNGLISTIGTNKAIEAEKDSHTRVLDLKGRTVFPGFNDSHLHFTMGALSLSQVNLSETVSIEAIQRKLKDYATTNPMKKWILGGGWDHTALPGQKYPTKEELDAAVSDRPAFLWHIDHHMALVNSKAIEMLGISSTTGLLQESEAMDVSDRVEKPSSEQLQEAYRQAALYFAENGVTSVQGGPLPNKSTYETLDQELKWIQDNLTSGKQTFRYSAWGKLDDQDGFLKLKEKYKDLPADWVHVETLKGFVDGVLSNRTAALIEPYSDDKKAKGEPLYSQDKLNELVLKANRAGLPVALHAIGDRAVGMSVIAFSNAKKQLFNSRLRNRVEHIEVAPSQVFQRFKDLGIVASMQPSHLIYDNESLNYNEKRLGSARVKNAFAFRNFLNRGAHLTFGSDWPVMPVNPMIGLFGAVFRQNFNYRPPSGWISSQRLRMSEALEAFTLGGAFATRDDHLKGSLREGKFADLVVLSADPLRVSAKELLKIKPIYTIVAGKIVYDGTIPQIRNP